METPNFIGHGFPEAGLLYGWFKELTVATWSLSPGQKCARCRPRFPPSGGRKPGHHLWAWGWCPLVQLWGSAVGKCSFSAKNAQVLSSDERCPPGHTPCSTQLPSVTAKWERPFLQGPAAPYPSGEFCAEVVGDREIILGSSKDIVL